MPEFKNLKDKTRDFSVSVEFREQVFISLFYSLNLVYLLFKRFSITLENFSGRSISQATAEGIDIGKRVSVFYEAAGIFVLLFLFITWRLEKIRKQIHAEDLQILNVTSAAGLILLFFQIYGTDLTSSFNMILAVQLSCIAGIIGKNYFNVRPSENSFANIFTWCFSISFILFFLLSAVAQCFRLGWIASLPKFALVVSTFMLLLILKFFRNNKDFETKILKWAYVLRPFAWLPLLSFIAAELFMILNQHGFFSISPFLLYLFGIIFLTILSFRSQRNFLKQKKEIPTLSRLLASTYFPLIIAGLGCFAYYKPVLSPVIDWFEDANRILPLQQFHEFGKIPFIQTFSSHALYDFGLGFLYSFLNGYNQFGGFVYGFLMSVVVSIVIYFFIKKITGNYIFAFFLVILFPYTEFILPSYYNVVPLTALALLNIYQRQSFKSYFLFFLFLAFMTIWKFDLGSANLISGIAGLSILCFAVPGFKPEWKVLFKGLIWIVIPIIFIFCIVLLSYGSLVFHHMREALGYLSSFQSYGVRELSLSHDFKYFSLYYFLPVAVLIVLGYSFIRLISIPSEDNKMAILPLTLIFLSIFYFANFQRGMVRHTLAEQWDTALTSYGFFILAASTFYSQKQQFRLTGFVTFVVVAMLLVVNYKYSEPEPAWANHFTYLVDRTKTSFFPEKVSYRIERTPLNASSNKDNYRDLDVFMKSNFPDDATFLDFSNTPMMYAFLHRTLPGYLCQMPHTAHNDEMQQRLIDGLKNYNVPIVLFSNYPESFWDHLDGIPNVFRHYRIAEYIYSHYEPYAIINHHSVWIAKGTHPALSSKIIYQKFNLVSTPLHDAILIDSFNVSTGTCRPRFDNLVSHSIALNPSKKYFLKMNGSCDRQGNITVIPEFDKKESEQKTDVKIYEGRMQVFAILQPTHGEKELTAIQLLLPPGTHLGFTTIQISECDVIPDYVSEQAAEHNLKYIPYIWGQFDKKYRKENFPVIANLIKPVQEIKNETLFTIGLPDLQGKDSSSYLRIRANANDSKTVQAIIHYGLNDETQGGFVITLKDSPEDQDYLIRISTQYNWINKEHNWMTIYPMGGDIRLSSADLLQGD